MGSRLQHKQKRAALEANVTALCKKFKFHEVAEHVLPIFRNVTLERILRTIKKNKKTVTSERIGQVLVEEKKDEPYAFLEDMYFELYLKHKIVHSINYTWYAFKMLQSEGKAVLVTAMQISEALKDSFRSLHPAPRIKVQLYGAFTWIMIVQKKKKVSGEELVQKYIFAYTPGEQYIFASQKNIKTDIADGLLFTFGYKKLNDCNLSASDIKSMVILLMNKAAKAFDAHSAQHTAAPYAPGPGVVTENGMDFTDQHLKQNYANMIFGKDCPAVKKLTVKEEGQVVRNKQMYRSSFTIVSNNVYELLKGLFVRGVIVIPLSPYIERLLTLGKNYIIIRPINESLSQKEQQN